MPVGEMMWSGMPSLSDKMERHVVIDRRDGEYICFPDVVRAADGRLVVAYNEADQHVGPSRRALLLRMSRNGGRTWGDIVKMDTPRSHCPRIVELQSGELFIIDNANNFTSGDNGDSWTKQQASQFVHDMADRIIDLGDDVFISTGHNHRGTYPQPAIRQAPAEQMVYRSEDRGASWQPISVIGRERNLVLCEGSMTRLADGRILCLLRENSFVYEPMYLCISEDEGCTWSSPVPTPLIGHRPTIGLVDEDRLLVTYRNVGPDMGTCAWTGSLDELAGDFRVHGRHDDPANPKLAPEGLHIKNEAGEGEAVRYALRPLTDPRSAKAVFKAEVRVNTTDENGCGMRLGVWWRIFSDRIVPDVDGATPVPLPAGDFNRIRLEYATGVVTLFVNGQRSCSVSVDGDHANTRPILLGACHPSEANAVDCVWRQISLHIEEPHLQRSYQWDWTPLDGFPDHWAQDNILELKNDRFAAPPDFGYSGWVTLEDGTFFCVYHHGGGDEEGYEPMFTSYVMGTRFSLADFAK